LARAATPGITFFLSHLGASFPPSSSPSGQPTRGEVAVLFFAPRSFLRRRLPLDLNIQKMRMREIRAAVAPSGPSSTPPRRRDALFPGGSLTFPQTTVSPGSPDFGSAASLGLLTKEKPFRCCHTPSPLAEFLSRGSLLGACFWLARKFFFC